MKKPFALNCPKCIEPQTTLDNGEHTYIYVTAVHYGARCEVALHCTVCGTTIKLGEDDLMRRSVSHEEFISILK